MQRVAGAATHTRGGVCAAAGEAELRRPEARAYRGCEVEA